MAYALEETRFYRFGNFRLNAKQRLLFRGGELILLSPKVFDTLLALVERSGEVVEKDHLLRKVWPDSFVEEGSLAQNISRLRRILGGGIEGQQYIQTIPKRGYRFVAHLDESHDASGAQELLAPEGSDESAPSIAILPFANLSGDKEQEYFSDGLGEEIINALAQTPGLKVTARTSAFAFRGKVQDITKIAETLRVRFVLEGSVRKSGNRIRVTVRLIKAADGYQLWGQCYDRDLTDLLALQDEIAGAIVEALQIKLVGETAGRVYRPELRAYDLSMRGRYELSKITPESAARAKELLEQAIARDPGYSEPYAELGQYHFLYGASGRQPASKAREALVAARRLAQKALGLNCTDPRAHALLCTVAGVYDHDWNEADCQSRLALAADPVSPTTVRSRCAISFLLPLGRFQEALVEFERAVEYDPVGVVSRGWLAQTLLFAGLYDRAFAEAEKCLQLDENHWLPLLAKILILVQTGELTAARLVAEKAVRVAPWRVDLAGLLAAILTCLGEIGRAQELLANLKEMSPVVLFWYHLLCSDLDAAADYYAKMIERCDAMATFLAAASVLKPLRSCTRWPQLARMMNLPVDTVAQTA